MSAMQKIEKYAAEQDAFYSVTIDGNRHQLGKRIVTKKELVTAAKCRGIVASIEDAFGIEVGEIVINMDEYDYREVKTESDAELVLSGDWSPTRTLNKNAKYYPKSNTLQIWQNGLPIYENADGAICRDKDALADCLC